MTAQAIFYYLGFLMIGAFIAFVVWGLIYFMRQDIRGVMDDLSGKAKQQDIESRAKNFGSGSRRGVRKTSNNKPIDIFTQDSNKAKLSKISRKASKTNKASKGALNVCASQVQPAQKKKTSQELFSSSGYTTTGDFANQNRDMNTNNLENQDSDTQVINEILNSEFDFEVVESYVIVNSQIDLLK